MPMDWGLARDYAAWDVHTEETRVTEAQWLACAEPSDLDLYLGEIGARPSERKLRLFGCACVRGVWKHLPEDAHRQAIEVCERFADNLASAAELRAVRELAHGTYEGIGDIVADHSAVSVTALCEAKPWFPMGAGSSAGIAAVAAEVSQAPFHVADSRVRKAHSTLFRDVVGNPFRRAEIELAWQTPIAVSMAKAAYERRRLPKGTLDRERLSLLADALEDAGCTDAELLGHLRSPGPHVRGCWAVDLVLGKE
jgi:hypothetical protein